MQSTKTSDKRADSRHDCRVRLTLQEESGLEDRLQAVALNVSRGGVLIEAACPLWPGMEFRILPEPDAAPVEWAAESATVRWCIVDRAPGRKALYLAGL
ncbi:MAG: PilZ domain-containing protein, partial [Desulfobacterales bacterium]|nr:PilZ domain-containing protein [Desulfobacterales bacterium]